MTMESWAQGSYGTIYRSRLDGKKVAIKVVPRTPESEREVRIAQLFSDREHFVPILQHKQTEMTVSMTMPFIPETVLDLIKERKKQVGGGEGALSLSRAFSIFEQVLSAVKTMHETGYVHKDLKLENFLYRHGRVYLCDFGFSRSYMPGVRGLRDNRGSVHYAAPELWLGIPYEGPEVDIWALGVCLYVMTTGFFPFSGRTRKEVFRNIEQESGTTGRVPYPPGCMPKSTRFCDLINRMLTFDLGRRITLPEIEEHPFVVSRRRKAMRHQQRKQQKKMLGAFSSSASVLPSFLPPPSPPLSPHFACSAGPLPPSDEDSPSSPPAPSVLDAKAATEPTYLPLLLEHLHRPPTPPSSSSSFSSTAAAAATASQQHPHPSHHQPTGSTEVFVADDLEDDDSDDQAADEAFSSEFAADPQIDLPSLKASTLIQRVKAKLRQTVKKAL